MGVSLPFTYQKWVPGLQMLMKVPDHTPQLASRSSLQPPGRGLRCFCWDSYAQDASPGGIIAYMFEQWQIRAREKGAAWSWRLPCGKDEYPTAVKAKASARWALSGGACARRSGWPRATLTRRGGRAHPAPGGDAVTGCSTRRAAMRGAVCTFSGNGGWGPFRQLRRASTAD